MNLIQLINHEAETLPIETIFNKLTEWLSISDMKQLKIKLNTIANPKEREKYLREGYRLRVQAVLFSMAQG